MLASSYEDGGGGGGGISYNMLKLLEVELVDLNL